MHALTRAAMLATALLAVPAHAEILDNSFFIEEAYNQERGIVQHIQTLHWSREREAGQTKRSLSYGFTQEWPVGGQRNQLSYTIPYERLSGSQPKVQGIGDVQIHYRYQLLKDTDSQPAFAPRLTLILPTGNEDEGLGAGTTGFQVNLPLSKQLERVHLHVNAGATLVPGAKVKLPSGSDSPERNLLSTAFGFSVIPMVKDWLNLMFEALAAVEEEIDVAGETIETTRILVAPGVRFAIDRKDGGQWVLGAAAPIGVSDDEEDFGALLYLSFEHPF
jgi:hypothetical protein